MTAPPADAAVWPDLMSFLEERGIPHEVVDGSVVVNPPPSTRHERVVAAVLAQLWHAAPAGIDVFGSNLGFWYDDTSYLTADVTVVRGEDLRHPNAAARILSATSPGGQLWCRAWSRPGRMLGYCCDPQWVRSSLDRGAITAARIDLGRIAAGAMTVAWWDADRGVVLARESIVHPGGPLVLNPPAFARHIGFKLVRE